MSQSQPVWWASESLWRKVAIWVTGGSLVALIFLTFDTMAYIKAGGINVPAYSIINKRVGYEFNEEHNRYEPVIGPDEPLFGKMLSEEEAKELVSKGKLNVQAKNCMGCHTLMGNGSYYAPDLTKSWLDPAWGSKEIREDQMVAFIMDPSDKLHNGLGRKMPRLGITEEEARATVAFLKWMSAINTMGFPHNFKAIDQSDPEPSASATVVETVDVMDTGGAADNAPAQQ
ncbi:MAG TPA: cytochrome c [Thiobacillaceae bacterium]|nr:cytochrome c [Thiobacillaceae bacterium]HNU64116.1 cytochrome c [Thiobacillaceae bacterium]